MHHSFTPPASKQLGGGGGERICSHIHEGPTVPPVRKPGAFVGPEAVQGLCDSRAGCWDAKPAGREPAPCLGLLVLEKESFLLEMQT